MANERQTHTNGTSQHELVVRGTPADQLALLDHICRNTLALLAALPATPLTLRMCAGVVSVEVGWAERGVAGAAITASDDVVVADQGPDLLYLTAPVVGTFYPAPQPGAKPFTSVDEWVVTGQQVGIIETMKLLIPIEADQAGRIVEVLKGNGEPAEYGERLFSLIESTVDD